MSELHEIKNKFCVGDIYLFYTPVENPYKFRESEITYDERKVTFDFLKANDKLPDYVQDVWYAPSSGGAKKLSLSTVKYTGAFITGMPV